MFISATFNRTPLLFSSSMTTTKHPSLNTHHHRRCHQLPLLEGHKQTLMEVPGINHVQVRVQLFFYFSAFKLASSPLSSSTVSLILSLAATSTNLVSWPLKPNPSDSRFKVWENFLETWRRRYSSERVDKED